MTLDKITSDQILAAAVVILALGAAFLIVANVINVVRGWRKPKVEKNATLDEKLRQYDNYFATDKHRLEAHEKELTDLRDGQRALCTGVQALLEHELHNGNSSQMSDASKAINTWLLDGR
ncbi:MAG: hypothetical protein RR389_06970 [Christensenella sp.]